VAGGESKRVMGGQEVDQECAGAGATATAASRSMYLPPARGRTAVQAVAPRQQVALVTHHTH
jgi:hypothetical protein